MVTKAQLDKLSARIEQLAPRDNYRVAVIIPQNGETEEQAADRHFREHPEDRTANHIVQVVFGKSANGAEA
jgi:hypothetical protein